MTSFRLVPGVYADAHETHAADDPGERGTIMRGRSAPSPERDSIQTLVAVRRAGVWRLVAFQNTRIRPIGQNVPGTLCWLIGDWFWKWCLPT